jgi:hypothetical protein
MNTTTSNEFDFYQFVLQKHKFRIDSGLNVKGEKVIFGLTLDNQQGITFLESGDSRFTVDKTSTETVGRKIAGYSHIPAKIIKAKNGDIVLDADHGDIILKGANIRIIANDGLGGEITINSSGIIQIDAATLKAQTTNSTIAATNQLNIAGGSLGNHGEIIVESSTASDFVNASFFGKILSTIKKFENFFKTNCP